MTEWRLIAHDDLEISMCDLDMCDFNDWATGDPAYLAAEAVLARIWNNPDDEIFDRMGTADSVIPSDPCSTPSQGQAS